MKNCQVCDKELNDKNTADGRNGFEIAEPAINPNGGELRTKIQEACKPCYLAWYKAKWPEAVQPKI